MLTHIIFLPWKADHFLLLEKKMLCISMKHVSKQEYFASCEWFYATTSYSKQQTANVVCSLAALGFQTVIQRTGMLWNPEDDLSFYCHKAQIFPSRGREEEKRKKNDLKKMQTKKWFCIQRLHTKALLHSTAFYAD